MSAAALTRPGTAGVRPWQWCGALAVAVLCGAALSRQDGVRPAAVALALAVAGCAVVLRWRTALLYGAAAAVLLPVPWTQQLQVPFLDGTMYLSDLLLPAAAILALSRCRVTWRQLTPALLALATVFTGVGASLVYGNSFAALVGDVRGPVHVLLGLVIGLVAVHDPVVRAAVVRALCGLLWLAALAALVTSLTGLKLVGGAIREVSTNIAGTYTGFDALRFQIAATLSASIVLCVVTGLVLLHRDRAVVRHAVVRYGPPSLVLTFLSFSRNSLLGLALAIVFCGLVSIRTGRVTPAAARLVTSGLLVCAGTAGLVFAAHLATQVAGGRQNPVAAQLAAYKGRVVDMLGGDKLKEDASASFRRGENRYATEAIRRRPLVGGGFGATYRPRFSSDAFADESGTRYVHNYYLWIAIKTGLPGLAITLVLFTWPILRWVRRGRTEEWKARADALPLVAGLFAALGTMSVAPLALSAGFASIFGCFLGFLWGYTSPASSPGPLFRPRPTGATS